jgi:hypothetical protein
MFNIGKMKMTGWSKKASKAGLPQQWQKIPTKVINILFDPYCKDMMMLQSHDMFVLLDTTKVSRFVASHLYSLIIPRILQWDFSCFQFLLEISLFLESLEIDCTHPVRFAAISLRVMKGFC